MQSWLPAAQCFTCRKILQRMNASHLCMYLLFLLLLPLQAQCYCALQPSHSQQFAGLNRTKKTFASKFNARDASPDALKDLLKVFEGVDRHVKNSDVRKLGVWACPVGLTSLLADRQVRTLGWEGISSHCIYQVFEKNLRANFPRPDSVFATISHFIEDVASLAPSVVRNYGLSWPRIFSAHMIFSAGPDVYRECVSVKGLGYRLNGTWAIAASVTNDSTTASSALRGTLTELVYRDSLGQISSAPVRLHVCNKQNPVIQSRIAQGSAFLHLDEGPVSWSEYGKLSPHEGPATAYSLEKADHWKEMVQDSYTFSNLAILLLPVLLALVPIAVLQDTNIIATVLYAIATDCVSVMPVAIRGIELVVYGSKSQYAFHSTTIGLKNSTDLSIAQIWVAKCGMKPFARIEGIWMLMGAISAMIIGIVLEFVARYFLLTRKRKRLANYTNLVKKIGVSTKSPMFITHTHSCCCVSIDPIGSFQERLSSNQGPQQGTFDFPEEYE